MRKPLLLLAVLACGCPRPAAPPPPTEAPPAPPPSAPLPSAPKAGAAVEEGGGSSHILFGDMVQASNGRVWWSKEYAAEKDPKVSLQSHRLYIQAEEGSFDLVAVVATPNCYPIGTVNPAWNEMDLICTAGRTYRTGEKCRIYMQRVVDGTESERDPCRVDVRFVSDGREQQRSFMAWGDVVLPAPRHATVDAGASLDSR